MQLTMTERYNNLRMNDLAKRCRPKAKAIFREASFEKELVAVADRKLSISGDTAEHQRLVRRARRQHTPLHDAVICGDLDAVIRLVTDDNIDLATVSGLTPLHLAVFAYGLVQKTPRWDRLLRTGEKSVEEQIVNHLLEAGAPVEIGDDLKRLPAACVDGGRIPPMLASFMAARRERTERIAPDTPDTNGKPTVFNCFFDEGDMDRVGKRGGPGNRTGRGGNPLGISKPRLHNWVSKGVEEE